MGRSAISFGDVHNDGYHDIGLYSPLESGKILVLNRLGPVVNVTVDSDYGDIQTIHYRPTATDYITTNGYELHNNLDIVVTDNIPPTITNVVLVAPDMFTITFDKDIDASSVTVNDFSINEKVYTKEKVVSVTGPVVVLEVADIFATDVANNITIVGEILDTLGNIALIGNSSLTVPENTDIIAHRIDTNTITINFTTSTTVSSSNTNVNAFGIMDTRDDVSVNVASWSISGAVITMTTSGLTETNGTYAIVYDSSHGTALTSDGVLVDDKQTVTAKDKIPPKYIDTIVIDVEHIILQFSEELALDLADSLSPSDITFDPSELILDSDINDPTYDGISVDGNNIVLTMNKSLVSPSNISSSINVTYPTVTYSASIEDLVGNSESQSNTAVAKDGYGPVIAYIVASYSRILM